MAQQVKSQVSMPVSPTGVPIGIQLLATALGKAGEDDTSTWTPDTHRGDHECVPGSCFDLAHTWLLWPFGE